MKKNHFAVNQDNQLLIKPKGAKKPIKVDGQFSLDKDNNLIYLLNQGQSPSGTVPFTTWQREYSVPNKIKFKGNWQLSPNYDLELYLDKTKEQFKDDCLRLCGKILCAEAERLVFQIKSRDKRGVNRLSLFNLSGIWQADKFNRIIFQVRKKAKPETLVLKGAWQINNNQQIIYEYQKAELKIKRKIDNALTFSGFWQISSANLLRYIFSHSSQSRFDFRVHLQTPNVYPKKGAIKYRLGIGVKEDLKPARIQVITLYGNWKFSRSLGLYFEMDYGQGKLRRLVFDTEVNLSQRDKVIFKLRDNQGRRLGISVIFRRRFLPKHDAEWFLRLKRDFREKKIDTGVRFEF